ncbi:hypothetical protein ACFPVX_13480 [Cohnella faecalis]|uniref:Thioredoxin domain-containing protein n=1 Tax=Cohnella faecalis TaxID=2315694 RepID=A0A398CKA2_9BACL|nr:hypothetical protein [Cohnella faecalis]RIE00317.1 hypothetical protein D3H35_29305 [Cohnella faecalis]RIE02566.1 hypothetical protein D3H35_17935 [Cohnella faecalis]
MEENNIGHRKFLKSSRVDYELGTFLPSDVILMREEKPVDLSWLSQTVNGSVMFFLSSYCEVCDAEIVIQTINDFPEYSYAIFFESPNNPVLRHAKLLDERGVKLYPFQLNQLESSIKVQLVPFQLVLNTVGQVITAGIINTLPMIKALMMPLIRTKENNRNEELY